MRTNERRDRRTRFSEYALGIATEAGFGLALAAVAFLACLIAAVVWR
jgi:hypothetical protein